MLDRGRILEFNAAVLAAGTSRRPGVPRWSELTVYLVSDGSYLISRVGRSTIAHAEGCEEVTWRTPRWLDASTHTVAIRLRSLMDRGLVRRIRPDDAPRNGPGSALYVRLPG